VVETKAKVPLMLSSLSKPKIGARPIVKPQAPVKEIVKDTVKEVKIKEG